MKFAIYMHGGSGNHGCEALVRTICNIIKPLGSFKIFSKRAEEDKKYIPEFENNVTSCGRVPPKNTAKGFASAIEMKLLHNRFAYVKYAFEPLLTYCKKEHIAISIGGDNYCYDGMPELLAVLNKRLNKRNTKTVLFGCSIEPELLKDKAVVADLSRYALITARESITHDAIKNAGVDTDVMLAPDPAFTLDIKETNLPIGFEKGNTVGINISPLILDYGSSILFDAYCNLIKYIIEKTNMKIALIPHVVWKENNDLTPINAIFERINNPERIIIVNDCSAVELKYIISNCRMFIGARTHSTIAAYSTCVPTLVVGYSVKSRGIARDLFGTEENYVINSSKVSNDTMLIDGFKWLLENEQVIREHLEKFMPEYIEKARLPLERIKKLC